MKRAAILTVAILAICLLALWLGRPRHMAPIDVLIDHQPWCAGAVSHRGSLIILTGVERGVCTTRNVIRN